VHSFRLATALALVVGLGGCSSDQDTGIGAATAMPTVQGLRLDVALSDIKRAGFGDDVEVVGGGVFGVVDESNWMVCEQSPAAGQALTSPRLTVDRECGGHVVEATTASSEPAAPEPTVSAVETAAAVETLTPATERVPGSTEHVVPTTILPAPQEAILTVENSPELAAILAEGDYCADSIEAFATTYRGRTIEFDGHLAFVTPHEDYETRWDFLISPGEAPGTVGPSFQFRDKGRADLNLTDESIPGLSRGDNLHIVAKIEDYNPVQCTFYLDPVSTTLR
jgi:Domain of unknown function (DUF4839)